MSVDPLVEKYPAWSPYNYVMNNPINLIDPTGMGVENNSNGYIPPTKGEFENGFIHTDLDGSWVYVDGDWLGIGDTKIDFIGGVPDFVYAYQPGGTGHATLIDVESGIGMEVFHPNDENGITYNGKRDFVNINKRASIYQSWNIFEPGTFTPYMGKDTFNQNKNFWMNGGINGAKRAPNGMKLDFIYVTDIQAIRKKHYANYYMSSGFRYIGEGVCTNYCTSLIRAGGNTFSGNFGLIGLLPWVGNGLFSTYDYTVKPPKIE